MKAQLTDSQLVDDVIGTLARYGWNVDRASLPMTLPIIMDQLKASETLLSGYSARKPQNPFIKLRIKKGRAAEAKINNVVPFRGQRIALEHDALTRRIRIYRAESGSRVTQYGTFACPIELALIAGSDRVPLTLCDDGSWIGYYEAKSEF